MVRAINYFTPTQHFIHEFSIIAQSMPNQPSDINYSVFLYQGVPGGSQISPGRSVRLHNPIWRLQRHSVPDWDMEECALRLNAVNIFSGLLARSEWIVLLRRFIRDGSVTFSVPIDGGIECARDELGNAVLHLGVDGRGFLALANAHENPFAGGDDYRRANVRWSSRSHALVERALRSTYRYREDKLGFDLYERAGALIAFLSDKWSSPEYDVGMLAAVYEDVAEVMVDERLSDNFRLDIVNAFCERFGIPEGPCNP